MFIVIKNLNVGKYNIEYLNVEVDDFNEEWKNKAKLLAIKFS